MMKSSLLKIGLSVAIGFASLFSSIDADAQMYHFGKFTSKYRKKANKKQNNRPFTTLQIGYNHTLPYEVTFTQYFAGLDGGGRYLNGDIYSTKVTADHSLGVNAGMHFPIYNFNEKMILAFTLGMEINMMKASTGNIYISPWQSYSADLQQGMFSMPFGMAFKYGSDASLVKSDRFTGTFGVAGAPTYVATKFGDLFEETKFTVTPFVFAELGVMGGFNWKLRATCIPFGIPGFKKNPGETGMESFPSSTSISAKSGPIFQIGIAIQPFAFMWDKYHW